MRPQYRIIHFNVFWLIILTYATLARSNSALPDEGDYTETCWSCFNVNFNVNLKFFLRKFNCASVGKQINFDTILQWSICPQSWPGTVPNYMKCMWKYTSLQVISFRATQDDGSSKLQRAVRYFSLYYCQKFRRKKFHSVQVCIWKWVLGQKSTFWFHGHFYSPSSPLKSLSLVDKKDPHFLLTLSAGIIPPRRALLKQNVIDTFRYVLLWSTCWPSMQAWAFWWYYLVSFAAIFWLEVMNSVKKQKRPPSLWFPYPCMVF